MYWALFYVNQLLHFIYIYDNNDDDDDYDDDYEMK